MSQLVRRSELRRVFNIAMQHFMHGPDQEREAWRAAILDESAAYRCYLAIANSLRIDDASA